MFGLQLTNRQLFRLCHELYAYEYHVLELEFRHEQQSWFILFWDIIREQEKEFSIIPDTIEEERFIEQIAGKFCTFKRAVEIEKWKEHGSSSEKENINSDGS